MASRAVRHHHVPAGWRNRQPVWRDNALVAAGRQASKRLLAPIIKERKGEHTSSPAELGKRVIRARIDGESADLSYSRRNWNCKKKHTIEVVVDRFKVRDLLLNRLAESFETAPAAFRWYSGSGGYGRPKAEELAASPPTSPARICGYSMRENWSRRNASLSTTRQAPARPATALAHSNISI
ncbi:hypothetical protein ACLK1S_25350 [Escherichia coli]